jgi:hypothetical protein
VVELTDDEPDADEIAGVDDNQGLIDDAEIELGDDEMDEDLTDADGEANFADLGALFVEDGVDGASDDAGVLPEDADATGTGGSALDEATASRNLQARIGERIRLQQVEVTELVGDSTFYVGSGPMRTLVVLTGLGESEGGPGDGSDGRFNMDVGDTVTLSGEVMAYQEGMRGTFGLRNEDRNAAAQRGAVLAVRQASNVRRI